MTLDPFALTATGRTNPLGIDSPAPEFAWRLTGVAGQDAYALQVATDAAFLPRSLVWESGWVEDPTPYGHAYAGDALQSRTRYWWRVRVLAGSERSGWSEAAWFETGLLHPEDWSAEWICDSREGSDTTLYFRTALTVPDAAVHSRAYVSALGWYRLLINGEDLTGSALVPRFTPFDDYVEYQVYDLADHVRPGANVIGIVVSEGRFRGRLGPHSKPARFGDQLAALAQFEFESADGARVTEGTDASWVVGEGRVSYADPKFGERADLRISADDWLEVDGAPLHARTAALLPPHPRLLVGEEVERVEQVDRLQGRVTRTPKNVQLVDFGQNLNGYARVRLTTAAATRVTLSYSEVLNPDGEISTDYLQFPGAKKPEGWFQRDEVILPGGTVEYAPQFAVRGFRYLTVDGEVDALDDADAEAVVISTNIRQTGQFHCSDDRLNRLWQNARWSMVSNFADTPTDCPTRERSGWTGDIQIFGPTAALLADTDGYLRRYLRNLAADQLTDGTIPPVIPAEASSFIAEKDQVQEMARTSVGWGDVAVMLPWTLYQYFADREVLARQYDSAKAWVTFLERRARKTGLARRLGRRIGPLEEYIVDTGFNWGEWLRPGEGPASQMVGNLLTGRPEVATAYFANSAGLLARIAELLDRADDAAHFARVADRAKAAYNAAFVRRHGERIGADRQDDYVRALAFGLLPAASRPAAVGRLVELIERNGDHLDTGFLSTALLLPTLSEHGRSDIAWRVLLNDTSPSWLAQVRQGATTIWETWEGYGKDGKPSHSHNHYAFGSVVRWLHEHVAGLRPIDPGYGRFLVAPEFGPLDHARSEVMTPYGRASAHWRGGVTGGRIQVEVPPGTRAIVELPELTKTLDPGSHEIAWGHGLIESVR